MNPLITLCIAGGLALFSCSCDVLDDSDGAIVACEEGLKKQLRAPATYKRISAEYTPARPLTFDDFVDYQETKGCPMNESLSVEFCEKVMNDGMLKAGSTRDWTKPGDMTEVRPYSRKAREDFIRHLYARSQANPIDQQQTAFVELEYDAANAYNAPIRSRHICRFGPKGPDGFTVQDMFQPPSLDGAS